MSILTKVARATAYQCATYSGLTRFLQSRSRNQLTILMYHRVLPRPLEDRYLHGLSVTPELLEAQVRWVSRRADILTVGDAFQRLKDGKLNRKRPTVCFSFDDGYWDNAEFAAPILSQHGGFGTFFVTSGFVLRSSCLWFDQAAHVWSAANHDCQEVMKENCPTMERRHAFPQWMAFLKGLSSGERSGILERLERAGGSTELSDLTRPMSIEKLQSLAANGHEVGSHTQTHPLLPQLDDVTLRSELQASREELSRILGRSIDGLCYPNGSLDDRVVDAAINAGYSYACTTQPGRSRDASHPHRLPRMHVHRNSVTRLNGSHSAASFGAVVWGIHSAVRRTADHLRRSLTPVWAAIRTRVRV